MAELKRPIGLGTAGKRLWDEVTETYDLGPDEVIALTQACFTADEEAAIRQALKGQPMTTTGSAGQQVANPLLAELRRHRETLAKLLQQVQLPTGDAAEGKTAARRHAEAAASARWRSRQRERDRQLRDARGTA